MSYTRRVVHGAGAIFLMSALAGLVSYSTRIILARRLGPEDYGLFYAVFNVVILLLFFRDLGLGQALIKYIAEYKIQEKYSEIKTTVLAVFTIQLTSSLVMGAMFFLLSSYLASHYFKDPRAELILQILALYVVFSVLFLTLKAIFLGLQKPFFFASFDFAKNLIVLLLILLFLHLGLNVLAPVLAYVLVCLILFSIYFPFVLRAFPFFSYRAANWKENALRVTAFGLPVFASSIGGKVIGYIDTLFLTHFRSLGEVGIYNAVLPSAMIFVDIGTSVGLIVFPLASELSAQKDSKKLAVGIDLVHRYFFALALPVIFTLALFAPLFIGTFFGVHFLEGVTAFRLLLLGVLGLIVASINGSIITGMGKPGQVTKMYLTAAALNVVGNLILIPRYGISGAAFSTLASYALIFLWSTRTATNLLQTPFPFRSWTKITIAAIGFTSIMYVLPQIIVLHPILEAAITIAVALPIYIALCFMLKLFNLDEIKRSFRLVV